MLTEQPERIPDRSTPFLSGGRRVIGLDVLRGIAILFVASGHMLGAFAIPKDIPTLGRPFFVLISQLAVAGVDIFFVLSGFLIGGILLSELAAEGRIRVGRFYARRALRLWPSYFLAVFFAWGWYHKVHTLTGGQPVSPPTLKAMWPFFLQVQNYYDLNARNQLNIGAVMQTWTLAALVQFYVAIPLVLLLLWRVAGSKHCGKIPALPWVTALSFIACLAMRWSVAPANSAAYDSWKQYFPTHLRLDELLGGVLAAYWVIHSKPALDRAMRYWPLIVLVSLAAFLPVGLRKEEGPRFLIIWAYTLSGVGAIGLILVSWWFAERRPADSPVSLPVKCLAQIGLWSYSIYLWHQPLAQVIAPKVRAKLFGLMIRRHMDPWHSRFQYVMSATIYFTLAIGIGAAMYYLLERPTLEFRRRLFARRAEEQGHEN